MHLLDERPVCVCDDEVQTRMTPDQVSHRPGRQLPGAVVGMTLSGILQTHCHQERQLGVGAILCEYPHLWPAGIQSVVHRITAECGTPAEDACAAVTPQSA